MYAVKKPGFKNPTSPIAAGTAAARPPAALTVADVMTREIVALNPKHTFADIVSLMARHSFRHYLVVEPPQHLVGVISDRDVLRAMARTPNWHNSSAQELMSANVIVVSPDTKLSVAANTMLAKRINCLPVVDDGGVLCGVITSTDLLKRFCALQELTESCANLETSAAQTAGIESERFLQEYKS